MTSKIGWHVLAQWHEPSDLHKMVNAAAVKVVGSPSQVVPVLTTLRTLYPTKTLIARFIDWEGRAEQAERDNNMALASTLVYDAAAILTGILDNVWVETFRNEPAMTPFIGLWDAECVKAGRNSGQMVIAGNFSQGYPGVGRFANADNPNLWNNYLPALVEINRSGPQSALLGLHEYISGGHWQMGSDWSYDALRHNEIINTVLTPHGLGAVDILSSEDGFDAPDMAQAHINNEQAVEAYKALDGIDSSNSRLVARLKYTLDNGPDGTQGFAIRGGASSIFEQTVAWQATLPPGPTPPIPTPIPPTPTPDPVPVAAFVNGDFEAGTYIEPADTMGQRRIPNGWRNIGTKHRLEEEGHPTHVISGKSCRMIIEGAKADGIIYQQVAATSGQRYRFNVNVLATCTRVVDAPSEGVCQYQIGIDPFGQDSPSTNTFWGLPMSIMDKFMSPAVEVEAKASKITIFLKMITPEATKRYDTFWDKATLLVLAQPQPPNPQPGAGQYEITQPLNIRAGRGKATADIGDLARGSLITVSDVSGPDADGNTFGKLEGYVAVNLAKKV